MLEIPGDRRFLIEKIARKLARDGAEPLAAYSVFEVTTGLAP